MVRLKLDSASLKKTPYVLIKYKANWGDEMHIEGAVISGRDHWEGIKEEVQEYFLSQEDIKLINNIWVGHKITYSSYEEWLSDYITYSLPYEEEVIDVMRDILSNQSIEFYWPECKKDIEYEYEYDELLPNNDNVIRLINDVVNNAISSR